MDSQKQPPRRVVASVPARLEAHAQKIADEVAQAWHRAYGSERIEVPLSVAALLAFIAPGSDDDLVFAENHLLGIDADEFAAFARMQWAIFVRHRPDLANAAWPLIEPWHGKDPIDGVVLKAAKDVADAAVRAGQLRLTGNTRRREVDMFGVVLMTLRSDKARTARGQIYTPGPLTDLMARMVGVPQEGESIHDPAAGTGGFFRSVAEAMREQGRNPATASWWAVDIDDLAIAALAVNATLWELGPNVILGVANTLANPDWTDRALAERNEAVQIAQTLHAAHQAGRMLTALDALTIDYGDNDHSTGNRAAEPPGTRTQQP